MFTGIVRAMGSVAAVEARGEERALTIDTGGLATGDWRGGDSVAVAGVCLTAAGIGEGCFHSTVSAETLGCTTLGSLRPGDTVNLEPALAAGDPLGGHYVTGHVDGVATVHVARTLGQSVVAELDAPAGLARYLARKGSVTVDGVSLTINAVDGARFHVSLVPHTLQATTLGRLRAGQRVNVEVDILSRYLERLMVVPHEHD